MEKVILTLLTIEDLQTIIIDCVNLCLKHDKEDKEFIEQEDKLLTIREASKFLNLSVPTLYSKHSKREIPGVCKQGKRLYFSKKSLIEWIKSGEIKHNYQ